MRTTEREAKPLQKVNILRYQLHDDGTFPNNQHLQLLVYKNALEISDFKSIERVLQANNWDNVWQDTVFDYHHYHSTAHEVLIVMEGNANILFGGPGGSAVAVEPGDVILIPAGVAHKREEADENFRVAGAYPTGQNYDIL